MPCYQNVVRNKTLLSCFEIWENLRPLLDNVTSHQFYCLEKHSDSSALRRLVRCRPIMMTERLHRCVQLKLSWGGSVLACMYAGTHAHTRTHDTHVCMSRSLSLSLSLSHTHTHIRTHARTPHARTHARTHAHTHTHAHTLTRLHSHP